MKMRGRRILKLGDNKRRCDERAEEIARKSGEVEGKKSQSEFRLSANLVNREILVQK